MRVEPEPEYENMTNTTLNFVPGTPAMNVPNSCTIVIIAGNRHQLNCVYVCKSNEISLQGKYLSNIDSVMTNVDRITEDLDHMPVAAFILKERQSDIIDYSTDER